MLAEFALLNCGEDRQPDKDFGVALAITNTIIVRDSAPTIKSWEGAMSAPTNKQRLLEQVQQEREQWEGLLAEIGLERMEVPGVTGDWTMKDTIAHMITWWRREVALLASAQRGEHPPDHPPQSQVPIINEWIHRTNRDRPLTHILRDAQDVWQQFAERLQALPEDILLDSERFAWMQGSALGPGILDNFAGHFHEEHEPLIRTWLNKRQARD